MISIILSKKRSEFYNRILSCNVVNFDILLKIIPQRNPHTPLLIFLAPCSKNEKSKNKKYLLFNEKKQLKTHKYLLITALPKETLRTHYTRFFIRKQPNPLSIIQSTILKKKDKILTTLCNTLCLH